MMRSKAYNNQLDFKIALDGPAGSGKGLMSELLAKQYQLVCISSGLSYRILAKKAMELRLDLANPHEIIQIIPEIDILSSQSDLASEQVAKTASTLAKYAEVRTAINTYLKEVVATNSRIIMEGRDIASVVMPAADLKLFISATLPARAERRFKQLRSEGKECILADIFAALELRDRNDSQRQHGALVRMPDAHFLDTTHLTPEQVLEQVENIISKG